MAGMIDEATKQYFDLKFEALAEKIESSNAAHEKDITNNIRDIERHRADINDLYEKDRNSKERIRELESKFDSHEKHTESSTNGKRFNIEMWILISIFIVQSILGFLLE